MALLKKIPALLALMGAFLFPAAQTYNFKNFNVEDGLPFVQVYGIFQDSKGYLWTGGYGGLSRYDGFRFTNFTTRQGLVNHYVTSICEDRKGNLWIATIGGLSIYDGKSFYHFTEEEGLASNDIRSIVIDRNNFIWIGTSKGLSRANLDAFVPGKPLLFDNYDEQDGLPGSDIRCMLEDSKGMLWLGTSAGVYPFARQGKPGKFTGFTAKNGLAGNLVTSLAEDQSGNLWVGTKNGISRMPPHEAEGLAHADKVRGDSLLFITYTAANGLPGNSVNGISCDRMGTVWVGTDEGMARFTGTSFTSYRPGSKHSSNKVASVFCDREGNVWAGTYFGLYKLTGRAFSTYAEDEGISTPFIFGILRDRQGNLWVGTDGGGATVYASGKTLTLNTSNYLISNVVWSFAEDHEGNFWVGTDKGLGRFNPGGKNKTHIEGLGSYEITWYSKKDGLISDSICTMAVTRGGDLWIGGHKGVSRFLPEKKRSRGYLFSKYLLTNLEESFSIWAILEDKRGNLWFGSYLSGLYMYNGESITDYSRKLGIFSDAWLSLAEDSEGWIYAGTFGGVYRFHPEKEKEISRFFTGNGLSSDLVYLMAFAEEERLLWVGTNQGLNKIDLEQVSAGKEYRIEHYGKEEGFLGVECNTNGVFKDSDGSIWFGTVNGLVRYDPEEYHPNRELSKTNITGIKIFYNDTLLADGAHLPHYLHHISFKYTGICFTNPGKVYYSFMMAGFDPGWSPPAQSNEATYSNMPPGRYTFKVRSTNNEFMWSGEETFSFIIEKPFWQTWWFRALSLAALILSVWGVIYTRVRAIRKSAELARRMDELKSEALRSQMNPHFLFNSMNAIQHYININEKKLANDYLAKFADLMRIVLENSRHAFVPVTEDIKALRLYLELQQMRFDDKFTFEITVDKSVDQYNLLIPPLVIQPYAENAVNHGILNLPSGQSGKLSIRLMAKDGFVACEVEDNGVGRDRAASINAPRRELGHVPVGMQVTRERIEILGRRGEMEPSVEIHDLVKNGEAAGTLVKLQLPVNSLL